jgi:hypothetical protein
MAGGIYMIKIDVILGLKYKPEYLPEKISSKRNIKHIECRYINVLYSPCWLFPFKVYFELAGNRKYASYLGGVDELTLSPGTVTMFPETTELEVEEVNMLPVKLTEDKAREIAWDYSKRWIIRKNRILHKVPILECSKSYKIFKPLYLFKFQNKLKDQIFYKAFDSLTGDLEDVLVN